MMHSFVPAIRRHPVLLVLGAFCLWPGWPLGVMLVGAGLVVWALFAERLGWHGPTRLFLSGVRSGLKSGESCCGPSVFSDICRRPDDKRR